MMSSTLVPILLVLMLLLGVGLRLIPWVFRRPLLRGGLTIAAAATGAGAIWVLDAWADGPVPTMVRGLLFGGIAAAGVIIIVRHLLGLPDVSTASATAGLRDEEAGLRDHGSLDHRSLNHRSLNHRSLNHRSLNHRSLDHETGSPDHGSPDETGSLDHETGSPDHGSPDETGPDA